MLSFELKLNVERLFIMKYDFRPTTKRMEILLIALALSLQAMAGCVSSREIKSSMRPINQNFDVVSFLASACTLYYRLIGHWPASVNDILLLPSTNHLDPNSQNRYATITNSIPLSDLEDRVAFKVLPNGKLAISIPDSTQYWGTNHTVTGIVDVPM